MTNANTIRTVGLSRTAAERGLRNRLSWDLKLQAYCLPVSSDKAEAALALLRSVWPDVQFELATR